MERLTINLGEDSVLVAGRQLAARIDVPEYGTRIGVVAGGGGGGISQADADARYLNIDGDTMTGILNIASYGMLVDSPGTAFVAIDRNAETSFAQFEFRTNGNQDFVLGASGSGAGRHFRIYTNGKEVDVLRIERNTGHISLLNGTDLTLFNEPTAAKHAATKGYVDARTPPVLVLGPAEAVPGGTAAGTVIVRRSA